MRRWSAGLTSKCPVASCPGGAARPPTRVGAGFKRSHYSAAVDLLGGYVCV